MSLEWRDIILLFLLITAELLTLFGVKYLQRWNEYAVLQDAESNGNCLGATYVQRESYESRNTTCHTAFLFVSLMDVHDSCANVDAPPWFRLYIMEDLQSVHRSISIDPESEKQDPSYRILMPVRQCTGWFVLHMLPHRLFITAAQFEKKASSITRQ